MISAARSNNEDGEFMLVVSRSCVAAKTLSFDFVCECRSPRTGSLSVRLSLMMIHRGSELQSYIRNAVLQI